MPSGTMGGGGATPSFPLPERQTTVLSVKQKQSKKKNIHTFEFHQWVKTLISFDADSYCTVQITADVAQHLDP